MHEKKKSKMCDIRKDKKIYWHSIISFKEWFE